MRNTARKSALGLVLTAIAAATFAPLASCSSTGIVDVYMSPDSTGARNESVFFVGQPIYCVLQMASGRTDETLLVSFQPLVANDTPVNLPPQLVSNTAPGKLSGIVGTPFPPPAVQARPNPNGQLVDAADATMDLNSEIDLINDLRAKMLIHFADGGANKKVDTSGVQPPMLGDADSIGSVYALLDQVRTLFANHIASVDYHYFSDARDVPASPAANVMSGSSPELVANLNELKLKMNGHIATIVESPKQAPGKYRCDVQLAADHQAVDFVILPGTDVASPNPMVPRPGQCNGDPVANCPDPGKDATMLRCCTATGACGFGPKGTSFCY